MHSLAQWLLRFVSVPNVAIVYALYDLYGREVVQVGADRHALAGGYRLPIVHHDLQRHLR